MKAKLVILAFAFSSITFAQDNFIRPFKVGNYYEYTYEDVLGSIRYNARIVSDTITNNRQYLRMDIYNEPPIVFHSLFFSFDSTTLNIYGGPNAMCPDSSGNKLAAGFNLPVGYTWNECSMGMFVKSTINAIAEGTGFLGTTDTLRFVERKDTVGGTIEGNTFFGYVEKFGYYYFHREYGSPFGAWPYSKILRGAIIDGVTYGSVIMDVNLISSEIPNGFSLQQNFPNPFNPSTIIKFSIPKSAFVSLIVYDQLGREMSNLLNEKKGAGTYQYIFSANNISSGIYYYTLRADDFVETKKMILIR